MESTEVTQVPAYPLNFMECSTRCKTQFTDPSRTMEKCALCLEQVNPFTALTIDGEYYCDTHYFTMQTKVYPKCQYLLVNGALKNTKCGKRCVDDKYCQTHIDCSLGPVCQFVIETGEGQEEICGRKATYGNFCYTHRIIDHQCIFIDFIIVK